LAWIEHAATGQQRKIDLTTLINDLEKVLNDVLTQMGKRELLDTVILPPFPTGSVVRKGFWR